MTTSILRFEKVKSFTSINLSESHIFRYSDTPNCDPNRTWLNENVIGNSNLSNRVKLIFEKLNIKPRKNAVLAMDCILSLSNDAFNSQDDIKKFKHESKIFLEKSFKGRCISAVLHLDETTPHIHALIIPLEKKNNKWKLNARDLFNKSTLSRYQKEFYSHMKSAFPNLSPPKYGSKASHNKIKKLYHIINNSSINEYFSDRRNCEISCLVDNINRPNYNRPKI
ncbi:MobV family relaxase [Vibrio splendidus]